ncbi:MAG: hypothetical protein ABI169_09745 [Chitinophagaceae bacterium]
MKNPANDDVCGIFVCLQRLTPLRRDVRKEDFHGNPFLSLRTPTRNLISLSTPLMGFPTKTSASEDEIATA